MKLTKGLKIAFIAYAAIIVVFIIANKLVAIPMLTFGAAVLFGILHMQAVASGTTQRQADGSIVDVDGKLKWYEEGFGIFSIILSIATVVVAIALICQK